mgnify:CR=1 FL=1
MRDDEEEKVRHQYDSVCREYLTDHHVLPDLEAVALVKGYGRYRYGADEVKEDDVENSLDEGDAGEHEHDKHHETSEYPDQVVHVLDIEVALDETYVLVVELPGNELGQDDALVLRTDVASVSDGREKLPSNQRMGRVPVWVHRNVDGGHDRVGEQYPGKYREGYQQSDEQ